MKTSNNNNNEHWHRYAQFNQILIYLDETNEIQRRFQSLMLIEDQWYLQSNYLESSGTFDELKSASIFKNFFPLILIYQIHHNEIYEEIEEEK